MTRYEENFKLKIGRFVETHPPEYTYFNVKGIGKYLGVEECEFNSATATRYLRDYIKGRKVFGAGRGWYSFIPEKLVVSTTPIQHLVDELSVRFPLLDFSCWSTEQLQQYRTHLFSRFFVFYLYRTGCHVQRI